MEQEGEREEETECRGAWAGEEGTDWEIEGGGIEECSENRGNKDQKHRKEE